MASEAAAATTTVEVPKKKKTVVQQDVKLSKDLAALVGSDKMPRSEVIKRMWQIIKSRNLQDPNNKQYIILKDDDMKAVFADAPEDKIKGFSMMKYLKTHMTAA